MGLEEVKIVLARGTVPTSPGHVHIDCSADGLVRKPPRPVYAREHIVLQAVLPCQQLFSAAFIAHVEANYTEDKVKNHLCQPIPHPRHPDEFLKMIFLFHHVCWRWAADKNLWRWLKACRLFLMSDASAA